MRFRKLHVVGPTKLEPREKTPAEKISAEKLMKKIAEAEQQLKSPAQREDAVLALMEAQRISNRIQPGGIVGKTVRESIRQLMVTANPPHGNLEETRRAASKAMLVAADAYSNIRWHKTARTLLLDADKLDPEVAKAALEANSKILKSPEKGR